MTFAGGDFNQSRCQTATGNTSNVSFCGSQTSNSPAEKILIKLGLNYKFSGAGPLVAKY
jgi:hypothetical protein